MPDIKKPFTNDCTDVYISNSSNVINCNTFDEKSDHSFIYVRFMNDNNFSDLGRGWKHKHRKITGGTHSRIWNTEAYQ